MTESGTANKTTLATKVTEPCPLCGSREHSVLILVVSTTGDIRERTWALGCTACHVTTKTYHDIQTTFREYHEGDVESTRDE